VTAAPVFICPPPKNPPTCAGCGTVSTRAELAHGKVSPLPGETFTGEGIITGDDGLTKVGPVPVPAWPVLRLLAYRCETCRYIEIVDMEALRA
jgi:hypothetical protein